MVQEVKTAGLVVEGHRPGQAEALAIIDAYGAEFAKDFIASRTVPQAKVD